MKNVYDILAKFTVRLFFIAIWFFFGVWAYLWCLIFESKRSRQELYDTVRSAIVEIWRM